MTRTFQVAIIDTLNVLEAKRILAERYPDATIGRCVDPGYMAVCLPDSQADFTAAVRQHLRNHGFILR